ncbi:MAG: dihydropteroate synthase, partial [Bdellovibrionaceae bacterium]|nr:dihydropteroate synthase [Pseudobdellovibrionaceae bacterium]
HAQLFERPFALLPVLELVPELKQTWTSQLKPWARSWVEEKPFHTKISKTSFWPRLVGVLNLTEDSFSDGGSYLNSDRLIQQAQILIADGAEILDIGAESTRPQAKEVSPSEELLRLQNGLTALSQGGLQAKISIDSRRAEVVQPLMDSYKIDFLNDVSGFADPLMRKLLGQTKTHAFVMHSLSVPPTAQNILPTEQPPQVYLRDWWQQRCELLQAAGIDEGRLIFDPGIGFGKSKYQSIEILNHLETFGDIQNDIMIGHSRKSFMTAWSDQAAEDRIQIRR